MSNVGCVGKHGYATPAEARKYGPRRHVGKVAIYRCKECGKFHVGQHFGYNGGAKDKRRIMK